MKRLAFLAVCCALMTGLAFAQAQVQRPLVRGQQGPPPVQNQQELTPQARLQNQMRSIISDLYVAKFREALELTDDQFIKTTFFIRSFIDMRFNAAMRRENINRQLEQLQNQANPPSKEAIDELVVRQALLDNEYGNMPNQFLAKIRAELNNSQILAFLAFNKKFFDEDLKKLIEQAREAAPQSQNRPLNNPGRGSNPLRPNKQGQN